MNVACRAEGQRAEYTTAVQLTTVRATDAGVEASAHAYPTTIASDHDAVSLEDEAIASDVVVVAVVETTPRVAMLVAAVVSCAVASRDAATIQIANSAIHVLHDDRIVIAWHDDHSSVAR